MKIKSSFLASIIQLPEDLLIILQLYLKPKDSLAFLHCSNTLQFVKLTTVIYELNHYYSHQYCTNDEFRKYIGQKIQNPLLQIQLRLHGDQLEGVLSKGVLREKEEDSDKDGGEKNATSSKTADSGESQITFTKIAINSLHFTKFPTSSISTYFPYLFHLSLSDSHIKRIKKIPLLKSIQLRNVSYFNSCANFSHLTSVQLCNCVQLTDVKGLEKIPYLQIDYCPQLIDISILGDHESLQLRWCHQICEIQSLGKIRHRLELRSLPKVRSIKGLEMIPILEIWDCKALKFHGNEGPSLFHHQSVVLAYCHPDLLLQSPPFPPLHGSHLQQIHIADSAITSVECFRHLKSVHLENCWNIVDLGPLVLCKKVLLINCRNVKEEVAKGGRK